MVQQIISQLEERLKQSLPGGVAHEPLRAIPVGELKPVFEHTTPPKLGSVLLLLFEEDGVLKFPLIKRTEYTGTHSGQISFPGGKRELNESAIETAFREAEEEIGIDRKKITLLGQLSHFFVIPSNFMVTPVVGVTENPTFTAQTSEVSRIIIGEVPQLLPHNVIRTKVILAAQKYDMLAPHFEIEGEVVWGATAMMLNEFRCVMQQLYPPS